MRQAQLRRVENHIGTRQTSLYSALMYALHERDVRIIRSIESIAIPYENRVTNLSEIIVDVDSLEVLGARLLESSGTGRLARKDALVLFYDKGIPQGNQYHRVIIAKKSFYFTEQHKSD